MTEPAYNAINAIAQRWTETMWAISWQFCLLGLAVLLVHWSLYRAAPNWRYWLWQILAIKLLLMPFWTAAAPWLSPPRDTANLTASNPRPAAEEKSIEKKSSVTEPIAASTPSQLESTPATPAMKSIVHEGTVSRDQSKKGTSRPSTGKSAIKRERSAKPQSIAASEANFSTTDSIETPIAIVPSSSPPADHLEKHQTAEPVTATSPVPARKPGLGWQAWLMFSWMAGVCWFSGRIVWQGTALSRRLRNTEPAEPALLERVRDAALRLGMTRIPEVCVIDQEVSPFVCGLWRPRLIMPLGLSESFNAEQLDLVLLHELAHVRRLDLIWGWIPELGRVLFFFHPLIYVVCNQIRFERELACDQLAMLSSGRDAVTYADTLVRVVGQFSCPDAFRLAAVESPQIK